MLNTIIQIILNYTASGVSDACQGSEGSDFSFAGPDNRKSVDYHQLEKQLNKVLDDYCTSPIPTLNKLWKNPNNGAIEQLTSYLCLQLRNKYEALFLHGSYHSLEVKGKYHKHIIAYYRKYEGKYLLVVLPLHKSIELENSDWDDTTVVLPYLSPVKWENILTKEECTHETTIRVGTIFENLPYAMLYGETSNPVRQAGILMHITSLPGSCGVGDFSEHAFRFVDFLSDTGQQLWQILPLNLCSKEAAYSPYSSYSAFACNTLFISPQQLITDNLINEFDLRAHKGLSQFETHYEVAEVYKQELVSKAYKSYSKHKTGDIKLQFEKFIQNEHAWLNDFALFSILKKKYNNKYWNTWPLPYRNRDARALKEFEVKYKSEIEECKFAQFLVYRHWDLLKEYANKKGIKILGDIPIYVSYNSVDVWAHPYLFNLNSDLSMKTVAGVPPDYFNANGQLWGMPIYNWSKMEQDGFTWWLERLQKNLQWFDLVRLDHFRGFSAYWEVPAHHDTALNGKWVPGPAEKFFDVVQKKFPEMPFVAEDLGKTDRDVFQLRDKYHLPGMKVVQFGFGENMPLLQHVPHGHSYDSIVYTGTHDNNTMKGWFNQEADKATRNRVKQYTGLRLTRKNCSEMFIRLAYASVAKIAIVPIQDWLGLDQKSRMNFPATTSGNWCWRMNIKYLSNSKLKNSIRNIVKRYGRF